MALIPTKSNQKKGLNFCSALFNSFFYFSFLDLYRIKYELVFLVIDLK